MPRVGKDSAKSYSQITWNHAVAEYERMKEWSKKSGTVLQERAIKRMKELESKYPQLCK